jgi:dUTPase
MSSSSTVEEHTTAPRLVKYYLIGYTTQCSSSKVNTVNFTQRYTQALSPIRINDHPQRNGDETFALLNCYTESIKPFEIHVITTGIQVQLPPFCKGRWIESEWLKANDFKLITEEFVVGDRDEIVFPIFNHHNLLIQLPLGQKIAQLILSRPLDMTVTPY